MANSSPDYKALYLREVELRKREEEETRRIMDGTRQIEEETRQIRKRARKTTFGELILHCHNLLSRRLRAGVPRRCTPGTISPPTGKYCPVKLLPWEDCESRQQHIYRSVYKHLEPPGEAAERRFSSIIALEDLGQRVSQWPIANDRDLEDYERFGVERYVYSIIAELCKIPAAREEFGLGDGVCFENHANILDPDEDDQPNSNRRRKPDPSCIHRIDGDSSTLLTAIEYKSPHKLTIENLRVGLRAMDFWEHVVKPDSVPVDGPEKLKYNATWLTGSAIVQKYHVMIQEGLEYSYITNGLALVLLRVPYHEPGILYYRLCEPNMEVNEEHSHQAFLQPVTAISRVLCLCLMSFRSRHRDQEWRNNAQAQLPTWKTSFDHTLSQIPESELKQNPPCSEYAGSSSPALPDPEIVPCSSPPESPTAPHQIPRQYQPDCTPLNTKVTHRDESPDSDLGIAPGMWKHGFSPIMSSPSVQRSTHQTGPQHGQCGHHPHKAQFCTQQCLLSLKQGGNLDERCPNVKLHQQGGDSNRHLISAETLAQLLKQQLDEDIDRCTPIGPCGSSGAPFKVSCLVYGYTVVGKGTTSWLWKEVSREAEVYHVLSQAQGSAVPVFLGMINLAKIYFLHGAGSIRHMLLMAWGGESINDSNCGKMINREITRSKKEIRSLGVLHHDLRLDNILWSAELRRAIIIDFHLSTLAFRLLKRRKVSSKRRSGGADERKPKRHLVQSATESDGEGFSVSQGSS